MIFRSKELNFRAWDKKNRVMIKNINKINIDNKNYIFMQDTGGVDNTNNPIYEGDFLWGNFYKDLIYAMYCKSCLSFRLHGKEEGCFECIQCDFDENKSTYISVIGNVFEGMMQKI